jgi:hypothetical protein
MSASVFPVPFSGIQETLIDAKGDLIAGTADNACSRLAVGTNGQVLTAASTTSTGLTWTTPSSGGMTQLVSTTSFGSVASVTLNSIDQNYKDLRIIVKNFSCVSGGSLRVNIGGSYGGGFTDFTGTWTITRTNSGNSFVNIGRGTYSTSNGQYIVDLLDYTSSVSKMASYIVQGTDDGSNADAGSFGWFISTNGSAISSITLSTSGGNFDNGTYELWGIK